MRGNAPYVRFVTPSTPSPPSSDLSEGSMRKQRGARPPVAGRRFRNTGITQVKESEES